MKIGFTRKFAIERMERLENEESFLEIDPLDKMDYMNMSNDELEDVLCGSGLIYDEHMAGVFDILPSNVVDAEKQGLISGWPVTLDV